MSALSAASSEMPENFWLEQDSKSDRCSAGEVLHRSGLPLAIGEVALKNCEDQLH